MKVGITGHQRFEDMSVLPWVTDCVRAKLDGVSNLQGLSSLAKGADQLFAHVVLELGGSLEAVLPFPEYDATFENPADAAHFRDLLARCRQVTTLTFSHTREESYLLAGKYIADHSELLVAVWDGKPAVGLGGTGDVVSYARRSGKAIHQIDPLKRTTSDW